MTGSERKAVKTFTYQARKGEVTTVLPVGELEAVAAAGAVYLTDVGPTEQVPGHQRTRNE